MPPNYDRPEWDGEPFRSADGHRGRWSEGWAEVVPNDPPQGSVDRAGAYGGALGGPHDPASGGPTLEDRFFDAPVDHGFAGFDEPVTGDGALGGPGGTEDGRGDDDREYEAYFDDDEDDFIDVEGTTNATRNALEWAVVLVGAVLVALLLRASLFQAFWIPSESMESTLRTNDRVLVNKVSYRLHEIHRGDIVVFVRPDDEPGEIRDLIKRVIGLPGETIEARDNAIYINGQRLDEPYLDAGVVTGNFGPEVVPEGQVFVMGDNRGDSYDSRWFGTVSEDRVIGRAFVLFWPINRVGSL